MYAKIGESLRKSYEIVLSVCTRGPVLMLEFVALKKMQIKIINFLFVIPTLFAFVGSHELPKQSHGHYTFGKLQESVHGESLSADDVNRLFTKLHFLNCSENKQKEDFRTVRPQKKKMLLIMKSLTSCLSMSIKRFFYRERTAFTNDEKQLLF